MTAQRLFEMDEYRLPIPENVTTTSDLMAILGIEVDCPNQGLLRYIQVKAVRARSWLVPGDTYVSVFTDEHEYEEDNQMAWDDDIVKNMTNEGFVQGIFTLAPSGELILHLLGAPSNVDDASIAIRLNDIQSISIYSDNASAVMMMQHGIREDGITYFMKTDNREIWWSVISSADEIEVENIIKGYWPEPKTIYERVTE